MTGTSTDQHVKILFHLEQDEDGYPPISAETLWAIEVGEGLYKIDNIPFFATGIAVDDIVSAEPEAGMLLYKDVVHPWNTARSVSSCTNMTKFPRFIDSSNNWVARRNRATCEA